MAQFFDIHTAENCAAFEGNFEKYKPTPKSP